jgi:hypothetical protein
MNREALLRISHAQSIEGRMPVNKITARIDEPLQAPDAKCAIPARGRLTMRSAGIGLAAFHCRYHVQFRARHGSHWCPTYKAVELKPYLQTTARWIEEHRTETFIAHTLLCLQGLLDGAGRPEMAQHIKRRSAASRAKIAFARLREANIQPERLLAIHMAVSALIEDDAGSHRVKEFRIVQVAKVAHRLASGTHNKWDWPMPDGTTRPVALHVYPKSSGLVLRVIGDKLEELCAEVTKSNLQAVRDLKVSKFGDHPSRLPGWRPLWARQRDAAKM